MLTILYFHQSSEMYGSDKVLLSLVQGLDRSKYKPIVILPSDGPLMEALREDNIECHATPLLLAGRKLFTFKGVFKLLINFYKTNRNIAKLVKGKKIDIVHSNTIAVLSGFMWAVLNKKKHVWHVHEIVEEPIFISKLFSWLIYYFSDSVICNSHATESHLYKHKEKLVHKTTVVWNGIDTSVFKPINNKQDTFGKYNLDCNKTNVLLMGRINRWKGQKLLVHAAAEINKRCSNNLHYIFVGSPPNEQENYLTDLVREITELDLLNQVSIIPFTEDIWSIWSICDIAVVPSTEPEPFGMVAIEAMLAKKPVIAANHGGLKEIVINNITGLLFSPGSTVDLADSIIKLYDKSELQYSMGIAGREVVENNFSTNSYVTGVTNIYEKLSS